MGVPLGIALLARKTGGSPEPGGVATRPYTKE